MTHEQLILRTVKLIVNCEGEEGLSSFVGESDKRAEREKFHFLSIAN